MSEDGLETPRGAVFPSCSPRQPQNFFPDAHGSRLGRAHHDKGKIVWRPVRNNTCGAREVDDQESCLPSRRWMGPSKLGAAVQSHASARV